MKRLLSLSLAAMFIALSAGIVFAHGPGWPCASLTPEQAQKMQQFHAESYAAMNPIMGQLYEKQAELNAQIYNANPDKGKIESLSKDIGALQGRLYAEKAQLHHRLVQEGFPMPMRGGMMGGGMGKHGGGGMGKHWGAGSCCF